MQTLIRFSLGWAGLFAIIIALAGCEAATQEKTAAPTPTPAEQKLQQAQLFEQRMSTVLDQIAKQDKALSDLRVLQDQTLRKAVEANKALMEEFVALRREMSQTLGYETAQPVQPATPKPAIATPKIVAKTPAAALGVAPTKAPPQQVKAPAPETAPEKETSRIGKAILRLVLVVILLAAIWLIIKIFMGRWAEDDDDDDEEEEEEEIQFPMGVAPEAAGPETEEPDNAQDDEPREEPTNEPDEEPGQEPGEKPGGDKPAT